MKREAQHKAGPAQGGVVPMALLHWAKEPWVAGLLEEAGIGLAELATMDADRPITPLGSTMLHLAIMSPHRPSTGVTRALIQYLLVERGANPNAADSYDRTPVTHFVTQASHVWQAHEDFGLEVLSSLLAHDADVNALFAPDFMHLAGCRRWTLAHHLADSYHGKIPLPLAMRTLLEERMTYDVPDSAGRLPQRGQLSLAI